MKCLNTFFLVLGFALVGIAVVHADGKRPPNIVLILADDLGWAGLGCYGSDFYETPNIDRLATEGVLFRKAYAAASTCAPSRASIMTGQYTPRHRILYVGPGDYQERWKKKNGDLKRFPMVQPRGETLLDAGLQTIGTLLQDGGYQTAMFGKWHLGRGEDHPSKRGFGVAIESHGAHFRFKTDPPLAYPEGSYLSDVLAGEAEKFIRSAAREDKPFFLYFADFLVHKPFEAKEEYLKHFGSKEAGKTQRSPTAGAMIKSLDDTVGRIVSVIDELDLAEETLVIFTSDNGGLAYEEDGLREKNTSNRPLRGRKGSEYDGGLRVPWIVRWPGEVPAGKKCVVPVHHVDLFPTLLGVSGIAKPEQPLDGIDLMSVFRDPRAAAPERSLFWYLPGYSSFHEPSVMVREGDWKLIRRLDRDEVELYQTGENIMESRNLAAEEADRSARMSAATEKWLKALDAPRMTPNPEYDPAAAKR